MVEIEKKFKFERKALARDYINKLDGNAKSIIMGNARTAGELAGLSWKQVQLMELKEFFTLLKEFAEFNDLADDNFLGMK